MVIACTTFISSAIASCTERCLRKDPEGGWRKQRQKGKRGDAQRQKRTIRNQGFQCKNCDQNHKRSDT
eukprot:1641541-Rhodomonas_salina.1